ncbi:FRG domain-containing protein [Ruegeria lacuscaerulensis]|uniref:FRG domain-containing protein n=1 Tax=Ruegeria lacuscaerulensis TaxID=55218 RepID=UPI001BE473C1|nr:FRG domain-containing protein [Ruegeria lacuscaerulensis]
MLPNDFLPPQHFTPPSCLTFPGAHYRSVETIADFFELINPYLGPASRWWFRGEKKVYSAPSLPGFARDYVQTPGGQPPTKDINDLELVEPPGQDATGQPVLLTCLTRQELDVIKCFQNSAPSDEYYEKLVGDDPNHAGWLIFAQHYGMKTRLVDVSTDPLVALYFASDPSSDTDGRVWMYPDPPSIHGIHPPNTMHDAFEPAIADKKGLAFAQNGRLHEYHKSHAGNLLISSTFLFNFEAPNRRVIAQRGKFLWSGSPLHPLTQGGIGVNIPANSKIGIRNALSAMSINEDELFPL